MSDLAKWKVRGEVRSVKSSFAEWDLAAEEWRGPLYHNEATFRPDGKLDESRHFNPDGTISHTKNLYDEGGLLIETQFWMTRFKTKLCMRMTKRGGMCARFP